MAIWMYLKNTLFCVLRKNYNFGFVIYIIKYLHSIYMQYAIIQP